MKIQELDINKADRTILLNEMILDNKILEKGHIIDKEDILFFKLMGVKKITTATAEPRDTTAKVALAMLAAKMAGKNVSYTLTGANICKFVAIDDGVFVAAEDRVAKFNRISQDVVLNVLPAYGNVKKDEVVAVLEVRSPLLEQAFVDDILFRLSGNDPMLLLDNEKKESAVIVYTQVYKNAQENEHLKAVVKKLVQSLSGMNVQFVEEYYADHNLESLENAIWLASKKSNLVFVVPSMPTTTFFDVIPKAIQNSMDEVVCRYIPQTNAADLIIAKKKEKRIISIPYNYDKVDASPLINLFIKTAIIKDKLSQADFSRPINPLIHNIELSELEKASIIVTNNTQSTDKEPKIAAIILAAGISARARRNKLMASLGGEPLFMKSVKAAIASKASPIFVITGKSAEDMDEYLEKVDVNVIHNFDYISGVKTSIQLGLRSVPSFCDGALLIPADMPNITHEHIDKMIKAFDKTSKPVVCVSSVLGTKNNPILWSADLFEKAELVPENSNMVPVLLEHSDYIKMIPAEADMCFDITFPNDIEEIRKHHP